MINHHIEKYGTLDKFGYKDFIPQFTLVRTVDEIYNKSYNEKVYSIKSNVVTNEDVTLPDLTGYTIKDSEDNVPSEYIGIYEKLGI